MQTLYILTLIATIISNSTLIFILTRRPERSVTLASYIILLILINIWAIPQLFLVSLTIKDELFIAIDKISRLGYTYIPVTFFIFALSFTNRLYILRKFAIQLMVFAFSVVFLYLTWNTDLIEVGKYALVKPSSWGYIVPTGPLFWVFLLWFEGITVVSLFIITQFYRTTPDMIKKKQALLLIIAMLIPLVFGTVTNGIAPALNKFIFPSAIPLTSLMALVIAYAIFRYELFELSPMVILSSIGNGVITVNNYGKIVHINNAARDLLGLHKKIITGKSFYEAISLQKQHDQRISINDRQSLSLVMQKGKKIASTDYFISLPMKKKFPVECTISPIVQEKKIIGATLVFRDITKEKELEKSKNEFIGIASHELKTPITAIKAFGELLEKKLDQSSDAKSVYFIRTINEQVDKVMALINDLLNVNRIEEGRFVLNKKISDIDALIKKVVVDFQYTTETHQIILEGEAGKEILIDEERIRQVLINLISNAIKYSPHSEKIIIRIVGNRKEIKISVQDFGIGIPKKDQIKIFNPFYRTSESQGANFTGFGLGLYICSEIIKRHHGKIWVKSKVGKGSTFFFIIPALH